ncbi:MAG: leucine-rich repeat domain-containing protein [Muribaculaceae bacterium]|nr:leucine-rich repeat domain-containing protein [Muribaculaceae bacterium]
MTITHSLYRLTACVVAVAAAAAATLSARTVVLVGSINATDLHEVATSSLDSPIETLDLSGAEVSAWKGRPRVANHTSHPAATLPAYSLSGLRAAKVILPPDITAIGEGALMGSEIESIEVPRTVLTVERWAFAGCKNLKEVTYSASSIPDRAFEGCTSLTNVTLADGLTAIGAGAFAGCTALEYLDIPASLKAVGSRAFARSGMRCVYMGACTSLQSMGDEVFAGCKSLEVAMLPDNLTSMGRGLFLDDTSLTLVNLPKHLSEVPMLTLKGAEAVSEGRIVPENVKTIMAYAYSGMKTPTTLTLPASLTYIDTEAFRGWGALREIDASELTEVPGLGENVWAGINQHEVSLKVWQQIASLYLSAPQWREFNIIESGIEDITDTDGADLRFSVRFEGTDLLIVSDTEITSATVVDISGKTIATGTGATSLRLDTSSSTTPFLILAVSLEDTGISTIKLLRP